MLKKTTNIHKSLTPRTSEMEKKNKGKDHHLEIAIRGLLKLNC